MSEGINSAGDSAHGHRDPLHHLPKVVEQTRTAWIERPEEYLPAHARIAVGIGFAALTRGGWVIYEEDDEAGGHAMTLADAERLALRAPENDWCIHLVGTNQERHYRRVGAGLWKLYRWGAGLAGLGNRSMQRRRVVHDASGI